MNDNVRRGNWLNALPTKYIPTTEIKFHHLPAEVSVTMLPAFHEDYSVYLQ